MSDRTGVALALIVAVGGGLAAGAAGACWSGPPPRDHYYRLAPPPRDQTCRGLLQKVVDEVGDFTVVRDYDCPGAQDWNSDYWFCRWDRANDLTRHYQDVLSMVVDYCGGIP